MTLFLLPNYRWPCSYYLRLRHPQDYDHTYNAPLTHNTVLLARTSSSLLPTYAHTLQTSTRPPLISTSSSTSQGHPPVIPQTLPSPARSTRRPFHCHIRRSRGFTAIAIFLPPLLLSTCRHLCLTSRYTGLRLLPPPTQIRDTHPTRTWHTRPLELRPSTPQSTEQPDTLNPSTPPSL